VNSEIYNEDLEISDLRLSFNQTAAEEFTLFQNTPNPFADHTLISFYLPSASEVSLSISDVTGKVIKNYKGSFDKGNNYMRITNDDLLTSGILYYTLKTDQYTDTKRMIVLK